MPFERATTDEKGFCSFQWTPDIPGKYILSAAFVGSESYWPSNTETAFTVVPAAPTTAPTATSIANIATTNDLMMYMVVGVIAIAIVGLLLLRKRQ